MEHKQVDILSLGKKSWVSKEHFLRNVQKDPFSTKAGLETVANVEPVKQLASKTYIFKFILSHTSILPKLVVAALCLFGTCCFFITQVVVGRPRGDDLLFN